MGLSKIVMSVRTWWFLRIRRNATIPADVGQNLIAQRDRNRLRVVVPRGQRGSRNYLGRLATNHAASVHRSRA